MIVGGGGDGACRAQHGVVVDGFYFIFNPRVVNGSVLKVMKWDRFMKEGRKRVCSGMCLCPRPPEERGRGCGGDISVLDIAC